MDEARLTRIARQLGYTATAEHAPTHADVFVHDASFCLEVQLVGTQFGKRTAAREAKGTTVCWLIREGLDTQKARKALFQLPSVRFRMTDNADSKGRLLTPWDDPDNHDLAHRARLQVFGTVAHAPRADKRAHPATPGPTWFRTGPIDGYQFLKEILSSRRRWYPPQTLGHKLGLWALETDVAAGRHPASGVVIGKPNPTASSRPRSSPACE